MLRNLYRNHIWTIRQALNIGRGVAITLSQHNTCILPDSSNYALCTCIPCSQTTNLIPRACQVPHAKCLMHTTCLMRTMCLMRTTCQVPHASCVVRAKCLMPHAKCLMPSASCLVPCPHPMTHSVARPQSQSSIYSVPDRGLPLRYYILLTYTAMPDRGVPLRYYILLTYTAMPDRGLPLRSYILLTYTARQPLRYYM